MRKSRTALVAVIVALWALPADAYLGERWRYRDAEPVRGKLGSAADGWLWFRSDDLVDHCHRVVQRQQDKVRNLKVSARYTFYISDEKAVGWIKETRRGDALPGANPCLLPGVEPGPQPKHAAFAAVAEVRRGFADLASIAAPPPAECNGCYRNIGGICALVKLTKRRAFEAVTSVEKSHGKKTDDHGVGETARDAAETLAACEGSQR